MEKYWKLLDLTYEEYSTHETEEEVNHIIDYKTRHFSEDKEVRRSDIETPFSNYDFQIVQVIDEHDVHQFLYFFDTIEEECDSLEERIGEIQARRDMEYVEMKHGFEHTINEQATLILILHEKLRKSEESNQLDELIDELSEENSTLKKSYEHISKLYKRSQDELFIARRSRDFWHKKFLEQAKLHESEESNQLDTLREQISRRNSKIVELKDEIDNLRKELKSALESLHDQYDDDDNPCCKNCVHCRPFIGSTDCYCSQTCEVIKNEHAETYYCKDMIPYEDDYPF